MAIAGKTHWYVRIWGTASHEDTDENATGSASSCSSSPAFCCSSPRSLHRSSTMSACYASHCAATLTTSTNLSASARSATAFLTLHPSSEYDPCKRCKADTDAYRQRSTANTFCTKRHIGYSPAHVIANADGTSISEIAGGTSDGLTRVMVLHPIECGLAFLAFLVSLGAGIVGSFVGAMIAFVAWILVLIPLAVDFSIFGILHHHVNDDGSGSHAYFGSGIWCLVASFVTLFFGILIVLFTCCSARREKNRTVRSEGEAAPRKKRFGVF